MDATRIGIEATTMAIREELMRYFKGSCIDRLTVDRAVRLYPLGDMHQRYQYQRRERDLHDVRAVYIGQTKIAQVSKQPDKIKLDAPVLMRSPQFREIRKGIERFLKDYLRGVQVEYTEGKKRSERDDTDLVNQTKPFLDEREHNPYQAIYEPGSITWASVSQDLSFTSDIVYTEMGSLIEPLTPDDLI